MSDNKIKEVEKTLGAPAICEFQPSIQKTRSTLFFFSAVALVITLGGLNIDQGSSFFGIKFSNLDQVLVNKMLFWVLVYLTLHFIWGSFDCFLEWRTRITGTKVAYLTASTYTSVDGDYPGDPRQSTLYNWWNNQAKQIGNLSDKADEINKNYENCLIGLEKKVNEDSDPNWTSFKQNSGEAVKNINNLMNAIKKAEETITSQRIPVSLERFDNWFKLFLSSQNLRWLVIEFSLPVAMSCTSIGLLW